MDQYMLEDFYQWLAEKHPHIKLSEEDRWVIESVILLTEEIDKLMGNTQETMTLARLISDWLEELHND